MGTTKRKNTEKEKVKNAVLNALLNASYSGAIGITSLTTAEDDKSYCPVFLHAFAEDDKSYCPVFLHALNRKFSLAFLLVG
jgi:hypothetical protein